jgi:5-methyltetrahydrofolate--homocysteine methyltransferase
VGKRADEIRYALDAGILMFNVESAEELHNIDKTARQMGKKAPVALRVNPDVDPKTHPYISTGMKKNKFGIPVTEALAIYREGSKMDGVDIVGVDFRDGVLFVPEVLMAAKAMKAGMNVLRPLLVETGAPKMGSVVIGTVKGDIHDIGKNLVGMMMEGAGFEVFDLGINNSVEEYMAAIEEHKPDILGMSALLTTTMPYMRVVIDELKEKGIRDDITVLVGGAPLNDAFAEDIQADAYCRDAAVAVDTAKKFMELRKS